MLNIENTFYLNEFNHLSLLIQMLKSFKIYVQDKIIYTFGVTTTKINVSAHSVWQIFEIHFVAANPSVLLIVILQQFSVSRSIRRNRTFRTNLVILSLSFLMKLYCQNLYFFPKVFFLEGWSYCFLGLTFGGFAFHWFLEDLI